MTEIIDVYTKDRELIGKTVPRNTHLEKNEYRLVVHICVFNQYGELLLQQRSKAKKSFGGYWDISAGGHCISGENSETAAKRELKEELGIDWDFTETDPLMCVNFQNGFDDYYAIVVNKETTEIIMQPEEVDDIKWVNREIISEMYHTDEPMPYFQSFFDLLFDMFDNKFDFLLR